jgi:nicotinamidase-related amidase
MNPPKIDLTKTALVLIDLQQGIMGLPLVPHASADVVRNAAKLADRFREAHAPVVLVNVNFSANGVDALKTETDVKMQRPPMAANWAELVPEIGPKPNDILITKRQWGAFHGTELDLQLRRRGITTIVLGGVATNMGVESTARPAHEHGYQLILVEDAMSSRSEEMHAFAVGKIFPLLGLVRSTEEVLAGCAAVPS